MGTVTASELEIAFVYTKPQTSCQKISATNPFALRMIDRRFHGVDVFPGDKTAFDSHGAAIEPARMRGRGNFSTVVRV